jgi:hypothetical protein
MLFDERLEPDVAELRRVFFDKDHSRTQAVKDIVQLLLLEIGLQNDLVDVEDVNFMNGKLNGAQKQSK